MSSILSVRRWTVVAIIFLLLLFFLCSTTDVVGFICGDTDNSGEPLNITDVTFLVAWLFQNGPAPAQLSSADCDSNGQIDISDLTCFVDYIFLGGSEPNCPLPIHTDITGPCISDMIWIDCTSVHYPLSRAACIDSLPPKSQTESMRAEIAGDRLHVYHDYAYYNCCLDYAVTYEFNYAGDTAHVTATESDLGEPCDCLCYFNLESEYAGISPLQITSYIVTLIGIEGDTVGIDTVVTGPCGFAYVEAVGSDLTLHHANLVLNCCPHYYVDWSIEGTSITAIEHDTLPQCFCVCYYNLQSTLHNVPNGIYTVTVLAGENILCPWDTITVDTVMVGTLGGPCDYRDFPGTARVISISTAPSGSGSCVDGVMVEFDFVPDDPSAPLFYYYPGWPDNGQFLTVGDGKHPNADWALLQGLTVDSVHPCLRREIIQGTCTPVLFEFLDVDYSSYTSYCF
ncbi:MAG: hypothetical protein P1R58_05590 [bacterium]|nr:hypothetical protein [bacterium]